MYPPVQARRNRTDSHGSGTDSVEERERDEARRAASYVQYEEAMRRQQQYFDQRMYPEFDKHEDYRR